MPYRRLCYFRGLHTERPFIGDVGAYKKFAGSTQGRLARRKLPRQRTKTTASSRKVLGNGNRLMATLKQSPGNWKKFPNFLSRSKLNLKRACKMFKNGNCWKLFNGPHCLLTSAPRRGRWVLSMASVGISARLQSIQLRNSRFVNALSVSDHTLSYRAEFTESREPNKRSTSL